MAGPYYVWSGASGSANGADWANAYTSITAALAVTIADDVIYVDSGHVHNSSVAITYTAPVNNYLNPVTIISVDSETQSASHNNTDTFPTLYERGAKETTDTGSVDINFGSTDGALVFIGCDFSSIDNILSPSGANDNDIRLYDCTFELGNAGATANEFSCYDSTYFEMCDFIFGSTTDRISVQSQATAEFVECSCSGDAVVELFRMSGNACTLRVRGFDASNAGATVDLIGPTTSGGVNRSTARLANIKMPTSWSGSFFKNALPIGLHSFEAYNVDDDSNTIYQVYIDRGHGTVVSSVAKKHTGTFDGTNQYSLEMTCKAAGFPATYPMWVQVAEFWSAANPTCTVRITSTNALTAHDVWIEVEAPTASLGSKSTFFRGRDANYFLGTGDALSAGSGWTGSAGNDYELAQTVSGGQAGVHRVYCYLASDAVQTIWIDPHVTLS